VDDLAGRISGLDSAEEGDEFLMPMALHTLPDDVAFEHVEGRRGAVSILIVDRAAFAGL